MKVSQESQPVESKTVAKANTEPKPQSSPNTFLSSSRLPPKGSQQENFAFGKNSRPTVDVTQKRNTLKKWRRLFLGVAIISCLVMAFAIWKFISGN